MKHRLVLEHVVLEAPEEDELPAQGITYAPMDEEAPLNPFIEVKAIRRETEKMGMAEVCSFAVEKMLVTLEKPSAGKLSKTALEALYSSLEGLVQLNGCTMPVRPLVALEDHPGYPTLQVQQRYATENLDTVRDAMRTLMQRINEIIARILEWLRRIFSRQHARSLIFKARVDAVLKNLEHQRSLRKQAQKAAVAPGVSSPTIVVSAVAPQATVKPVGLVWDDKIAATLTIDNHLITPMDAIRGLKIHVQQMQELTLNFAQLEKTLLSKIEEALRYVHAEGDAFTAQIEQAYDIAYQSNAGHSVGNAQSNIQTFETRLYFGARSYFRTAAVRTEPTESSNHTLEARLGTSTSISSPNSFEGQGIHPLTFDQIRQAGEIFTDYNAARRSSDAKRDGMNARLGTLRSRVNAIAQNTKYHDRALRRARRVQTLLNSYFSLKSASQVALRAYDDNVIAAFIDYMAKSSQVTAI